MIGLINGKLEKNDSGRWVIKSEFDLEEWRSCELTSGSVFQVQIGGYWIRTRIESSNGEYYAVEPGIKLEVGLPARIA